MINKIKNMDTKCLIHGRIALVKEGVYYETNHCDCQ